MKRKGLVAASVVAVALLLTFRAELVAKWRYIGMIRRLTAQPTCAPEAHASGSPQLQVLPTRYVTDRWFATPVTPRGDTLVLFLDTGGGSVFATKETIAKLGYNPKFVGVE